MDKKTSLTIYKIDTSTYLPLPFADEGIKAGFPSPAQDYIELALDINEMLVKNPATTFYGKVNGNSMEDARLYDGDIVVIDRSLEPRNGDKVVCFLDGDFTIKFMEIEDQTVWLVPANNEYPRIKITPDNDFMVWGVVTSSIIIHRK